MGLLDKRDGPGENLDKTLDPLSPGTRKLNERTVKESDSGESRTLVVPGHHRVL